MKNDVLTQNYRPVNELMQFPIFNERNQANTFVELSVLVYSMINNNGVLTWDFIPLLYH